MGAGSLRWMRSSAKPRARKLLKTLSFWQGRSIYAYLRKTCPHQYTRPSYICGLLGTMNQTMIVAIRTAMTTAISV